jgi:hypothetical protein
MGLAGQIASAFSKTLAGKPCGPAERSIQQRELRPNDLASPRTRINTDHTLEEVGQQFSVTRERIRQIEAKALRKLKHPSRSRKLRSFLDN